MTPLEQTLIELNAVLAHHDLVVVRPGYDYPYFHLYQRNPFHMLLAPYPPDLDEPVERASDGPPTLDALFIQTFPLDACADDILAWVRKDRERKSLLAGAASHDPGLAGGTAAEEGDITCDGHLPPFSEEGNAQSSNAADDAMRRTCARCSLDFTKDFDELQERLVVSFRGGYGSVFGDENVVQGVFCQQCVKDVLGSWLTVLEDNSRHRQSVAKPKAAYQPYQIEPGERNE